MTLTPRLKLPFIQPGQQRKEYTHNEALQTLDMLLHPCCVGAPSNLPPANPVEGQIFICGTSPSGSWIGHQHALAQWTSSGWRFAAAIEGMAVRSLESAVTYTFRDGQWRHGIVDATAVHVEGLKVLGARLTAIAGPAGGGNVDLEARQAVVAILSALRQHGLIAE